jgi:hypothetical protein
VNVEVTKEKIAKTPSKKEKKPEAVVEESNEAPKEKKAPRAKKSEIKEEKVQKTNTEA